MVSENDAEDEHDAAYAGIEDNKVGASRRGGVEPQRQP